MGLAKGVAGSKGRSVYVNLVRGLSAGGPLVTRTLIAVMRSLPSAAAEVASESHLETMNGAGLSFSRAQQGNHLWGEIITSLVSDSVTCYHAAGKGEIWKLDPPERRNSKNYTWPNG